MKVVIDPNPDYGIRPVASSYSDNDSVLDVRGCYAFTVSNIGRVKAWLYENIALEPGQQIPFENIMGLPFVENCKLSFDDVSDTKLLNVTKFILVPNPEKECKP